MSLTTPTASASEPEAKLTIDLSVLIPVYNEVENVGPLAEELSRTILGMPLRYELIFVDDGSTDGTAARLAAIQDGDPEHVRVAFLR
ncbi:glycosyltransferase, partial [Singulisphaera rosea]